MKSIELTQVVNAEKGKVWRALFNEYGDIHLHLVSNFMICSATYSLKV